MRRLLFPLLICFSCVAAGAQTTTDDFSSMIDKWKYTFSSEGRKEWKPEFTARICMGLPTGGYAFTGGVRINNNHTFGAMVTWKSTYIDAAPADIYHHFAGFYWRGYLHLGRKDIISLYSDVSLGWDYTYRVNGKYWERDGEQIEAVSASPGDIWFVAAWQPGIKIRFWKNIHIFLGPTFSKEIAFGLHFGVGF